RTYTGHLGEVRRQPGQCVALRHPCLPSHSGPGQLLKRRTSGIPQGSAAFVVRVRRRRTSPLRVSVPVPGQPAPRISSTKVLGSVRQRQAGTITTGSDRKSTRLNSSHVSISYAVFCLK